MAKVMSLTSEHISSAWGFKEELRKLHVSLTKIQAVLHDAEKRQVSDESVRIWLLELKDVAYGADNVLDEFGYEILRQKVETQNKKKNGVCECHPQVWFGPRNRLFIDDSEVVGRGDDVLEIVNLLIGANNQQAISVIPIVGMAGLGKTTIAKLVYKHELKLQDARSCARSCALNFKIRNLEFRGKFGDDVPHVRRLSLISDGQITPTIPLSKDGMGQLRIVFSIDVDLGNKLLNLKCLRGLTLSGSCIKELPKSIGKLRHLRLLHIESAPIKALPKAVTKLYNLQTLVIKYCPYLKELPNDLHNLISLRHIDDIDHWHIKQLPIQMGLLTCLQTLPFFVIGQDAGRRIEELGCLSQLRGGLSIYNLEHVRDREEAKIANLAGKTGVQKLGFHWRTQFYSSYLGEGSSISRVGPGGSGHGRNALFPALKKLVLNDMPNLVEWKDAMEPTTTIGVAVFPCLEELTIQKCGQLTSAPCHFPSLKKLDIREICSTTFERISSKLNTLTSLEILNISKLTSLPEQLLQNNTSLMSLGDMGFVMIWCPSPALHMRMYGPFAPLSDHSGYMTWTRLPEGLDCLTRLSHLEIGGFCDEVDVFPGLNSIQPASLTYLHLQGSAKLNSLPHEIQRFTALTTLDITRFDGIEALPECSSYSTPQLLTYYGLSQIKGKMCKGERCRVVQNCAYSTYQNLWMPEFLPSKLGLSRRKIVDSPWCDNCGTGVEDCLHALWKCPAIECSWSTQHELAEIRKQEFGSFHDLVRQVGSHNRALLLEKFAATCWLLWHKKNQTRLHLPSDDYTQIRHRAETLIQEHARIHLKEHHQSPPNPKVSWQPPTSYKYKVNFDGAIFRESKEGGTGVVIRDQNGLVIATLSQRVKTCPSAEMIEARAAKRAIQFALEIGIFDAIFEGDSDLIIREISSPEAMHNVYGLVLEDAKALLHHFERYQFTHTRRSGNTVAHALARRALNIQNLCVWMEDVPPDIIPVLYSDFSSINS
uniref:RNase H type-1 domain-containing protein n=1 Tax=Fagus sylvatica TaxID=28930 RepID=A0A2N9HBQ0_FAGSY